jgi:hypothetical protein
MNPKEFRNFLCGERLRRNLNRRKADMAEKTIGAWDGAIILLVEQAKEKGITMLPVPPTENDLVDGRFWFIGWILVVGEPEEWSVVYDPVTNEAKLRTKR